MKPVRSVTHAMQQLSSGDTDVDVGYRGRRDEIGQMVESISVFRHNAIEMRAMELENLETEKTELQGDRRRAGAPHRRHRVHIGGFLALRCRRQTGGLQQQVQDPVCRGTDVVEPGTPFETIIRAASVRGAFKDATGDYEQWLAQRIAQHRTPAARTSSTAATAGIYRSANARPPRAAWSPPMLTLPN